MNLIGLLDVMADGESIEIRREPDGGALVTASSYAGPKRLYSARRHFPRVELETFKADVIDAMIDNLFEQIRSARSGH